MALAAFLAFPDVAQFFGGMLEFEALGTEGLEFRPRSLSDDRVATIAVGRNGLAVSTRVFAIVAAKAAGPLEVADVVRIYLPTGLHLGKEVLAVNLLQFGDRALDGFTVG